MVKVQATGNDIAVQAAIDAGATMYCGYPITPSTEILTGWASFASKNKDLVFLQTEDECSAGFSMIGGILSGRKSWTATAGMGNVLMQDPLSMAEAMRIPTVTYIAQRGGPSTGTVIFSQQELNLTTHGGNGEGLRIVYSPSNLQEIYDYIIKAFDVAWKYRFPTFILSDGCLGKTLGEVYYHKKKNTLVEPILLDKNRINSGNYLNLRNCYSIEEELGDVLEKHLLDYDLASEEIIEYETFHIKDAVLIIFAHGSVAQSAKTAILEAREQGIKVGLFRPITLRPFPLEAIRQSVKNSKKILTVEASNGQFSNLVKEALYGVTNDPYYTLFKPAVGIDPEEVLEKIQEIV